jgi:hypothetical protein
LILLATINDLIPQRAPFFGTETSERRHPPGQGNKAGFILASAGAARTGLRKQQRRVVSGGYRRREEAAAGAADAQRQRRLGESRGDAHS